MAAPGAISDELVEKAKQIGGHPTREAAVNAALEEYVQHHQELEILELFGTVDFDPDYDYKADRRRDARE